MVGLGYSKADAEARVGRTGKSEVGDKPERKWGRILSASKPIKT